MFLSRAFKVFLIVMVAFAFTSIATAYAAANTLPAASYAGDGNVAVSGISVTTVDYTITYTNDPATTYITSVKLTLSSAVSGPTIKVKLVQTLNTWYTCITADLGTTYTCDTSAGNITVTAADNLRVIAIDD